MSRHRVYQSAALSDATTVTLSDDAAGHLLRVLRLRADDPIILFNGDGYDYHAHLTNTTKKSSDAVITGKIKIDSESPLRIHLGQGISRGDKMDFTLQKSVELGVSEITPLYTERCGVKLSSERMDKKREHWQKVVISACEQSGRATVPVVNDAINLDQWLALQASNDDLKLNLHPRAKHGIGALTEHNNRVSLLIGPEGGLSDLEIDKAAAMTFTEVLLGPRVLRTETAALCAISVLQSHFGDLG